MAPKLEDSSVFLVAVGTFEPNAAMPLKLGAAGAIRHDEAAAAEFSTLVPGQAVEYKLTWCTVSVTANRFLIQTTTPPHIKAADLMQKMVSELMPKAAVSQLGINRQFKIKFSSPEERDEFGVRIAPPGTWGSWGKKIQERISSSSKEPHGGLVNMTMREMPVPGRVSGWRDVQIAASLANSYDAAILLNDHYERVDIGDVPPGLEDSEIAARTTSSFLKVLREQFEDSLNTLDEIAQSIVQG